MKKHDSKVVEGFVVPKSTLNPLAQAAAQHAGQQQFQMNREQRRAMAKSGQTVGSTLLNPPENNKIWDELNQKSIECGTLLQAATGFLPLIKNTELTSLVSNQKYLAELTAQLGRDLVTYTDFYMGIRNAHSTTTGSSSDGDDHLRAISIFNDYVIFTEQYQAMVIPLMSALSELLVPAEELLRVQNQQAHEAMAQETHATVRANAGFAIEVQEAAMTEAQDPSVVSDAEIKTETVH